MASGKNPSKVPFTQKTTPVTGSSTTKNKSKLGFDQPSAGKGKTTSKKNPGKLPFTQKVAAKTGNSTAKNPSKASFEQPAKGGSAPMPKEGKDGAKAANVPAGKVKAPGKVGPKITSIEGLKSYAKKKYGV